MQELGNPNSWIDKYTIGPLSGYMMTFQGFWGSNKFIASEYRARLQGHDVWLYDFSFKPLGHPSFNVKEKRLLGTFRCGSQLLTNVGSLYPLLIK